MSEFLNGDVWKTTMWFVRLTFVKIRITVSAAKVYTRAGLD